MRGCRTVPVALSRERLIEKGEVEEVQEGQQKWRGQQLLLWLRVFSTDEGDVMPCSRALCEW